MKLYATRKPCRMFFNDTIIFRECLDVGEHHTILKVGKGSRGYCSDLLIFVEKPQVEKMRKRLKEAINVHCIR